MSEIIEVLDAYLHVCRTARPHSNVITHEISQNRRLCAKIMGLNLPTGIPFVYELDENLKPISSMKFLGDEETVAKAVAAVANQGKAK